MITLPVERIHCSSAVDPTTGAVGTLLEVGLATDVKMAGKCLDGYGAGFLRLVLFDSETECTIISNIMTVTYGEGP